MANVVTGKVCGNATESNGSGDRLQNPLGCVYSVAAVQNTWSKYREAARPKSADCVIGTVFRAFYCKDNSSTPASVLVAQRHGVFH